MKSAKVLTRIESPYEILDQTTAKGKYVFKKYLRIKRLYDALLRKALFYKTKENMMIFTYKENKISLTKELANELLYRFPDKVIVVGREKAGELKCSIRSGEMVEIPAALEKSLVGIQGYGGGHEHACGACIKVEDFDRFISNLKKELNL
jgi:single-stranded DNA-specific DHH superfamily exonuclease